jgi:hypothetical protein
VAISKHPRIEDARDKPREDSGTPSAPHRDDPLDNAHVDVPRWRPPLSSTPESDKQRTQADEDEDEEVDEDDDTLEFVRPRHDAPA